MCLRSLIELVICLACVAVGLIYEFWYLINIVIVNRHNLFNALHYLQILLHLACHMVDFLKIDTYLWGPQLFMDNQLNRPPCYLISCINLAHWRLLRWRIHVHLPLDRGTLVNNICNSLLGDRLLRIDRRIHHL